MSTNKTSLSAMGNKTKIRESRITNKNFSPEGMVSEINKQTEVLNNIIVKFSKQSKEKDTQKISPVKNKFKKA